MFRLQTISAHFAAQIYRCNAAHAYSRNSSTATASAPTPKPAGELKNEAVEKKYKPRTGSLVAAAFETLKDSEPTGQILAKSETGDVISEKAIATINNAKTVNGLLSISEEYGPISRKLALKVISVLAEWSATNRISTADFENDSRFLRICRALGRTDARAGKKNSEDNIVQRSGFRTDDLNTVLGVAGDDEAAKLIASINLPQMVKVMSALAYKKRRSILLLRSLAFNISNSAEKLNIKQCSDILYAMALLNFHDSVLSAKVCADMQSALPSTEKSPVVGSIITSLGMLRYRDLDILESITQWFLKNYDNCRPQDITAFFMTSGLLNFKSIHANDVSSILTKAIFREDFPKDLDWLNYVWSLALSDSVDNAHLESVLSAKFIEKLHSQESELPPTYKLKLLNLNSYARHLAKSYNGPFLPDNSVVYNVDIVQTKSKSILSKALLDSLKSLLAAEKYIKSSVDSRMGFLIDAICCFDEKGNPLPLNTKHQTALKIAVMVVDFTDTCQGTHRSANGITTLSFHLLERLGYTVIPVPYNEFNTSEKLLKRVQYLEAKLKSVIPKQ